MDNEVFNSILIKLLNGVIEGKYKTKVIFDSISHNNQLYIENSNSSENILIECKKHHNHKTFMNIYYAKIVFKGNSVMKTYGDEFFKMGELYRKALQIAKDNFNTELLNEIECGNFDHWIKIKND